jgi:hypothetical protein
MNTYSLVTFLNNSFKIAKYKSSILINNCTCGDQEISFQVMYFLMSPSNYKKQHFLFLLYLSTFCFQYFPRHIQIDFKNRLHKSKKHISKKCRYNFEIRSFRAVFFNLLGCMSRLTAKFLYYSPGHNFIVQVISVFKHVFQLQNTKEV